MTLGLSANLVGTASSNAPTSAYINKTSIILIELSLLVQSHLIAWLGLSGGLLWKSKEPTIHES